MKLTNQRNLLIYRRWSPIYDNVFDRLFASRARRRVFEVLDIRPSEKVLLLGIGTGADIPYLPENDYSVGIDLSPAMLARARQKLQVGLKRVNLIVGDAQYLPLISGTFDCAVLNLILSVVPNRSACLAEALQALKPGGRALLFDKFQPENQHPSTGRRLLNTFTTLIGTDITRRLSDLMNGNDWIKTHEEPALLNGAYRVIVLEKPLAGR